MRKKLPIYLLISLITLLLMAVPRVRVMAESGQASSTGTLDNNGEVIITQDAYVAVKAVTSFTLENIVEGAGNMTSFNTPEDIYYESTLNEFFVADTQNKRVLRLSHDLQTAYQIGADFLSQPTGIHATSDGTLYVADYGLKEVVIFHYDALTDSYLAPIEIGKPDHPLYGVDSKFMPNKITVDHVGTMYVIDAGNSNGVVTITKNGEFSGYFGANYIQPTLATTLKYIISSKEQRQQMFASPNAPTNVAFDHDGLLHTITRGLSGDALKKLNVAGTNLFPTTMVDDIDFLDLAISPTGTIYTIESDGYICEYDQEGNLLFIFGGLDPTSKYIGLYTSPKSMTVDNDYSLYIIDGNMIQVLVQTEFASLVHVALDLYHDGLYEESRIPWEKVLQLNNMFAMAHQGLGNAYLREEKYDEALEHFELAKDTAGYSDAYWEIRNAAIQEWGGWVLLGVLVLVITGIVMKRLGWLKKLKRGWGRFKACLGKVRFLREIAYFKTFIKHPLNGFYELKHDHKMGFWSATFYYFIFFLIMLVSSFWTGFIFNPIDAESVSLIRVLILSILPILLFVIANYLISSITEGNGKLKDVYIGTICSFAPLICFMPIVIILSNFLTSSESFLYTLPRYVLWGWSFFLLYFMIKDTQELQFGENNKNILLTAFTMVLFVAFGFLIYALGTQVVTFVEDVIVEVLANG